MGYHRAGFEVIGVDIAPQKHYPFEFRQADALSYPLDGFDVIHASPPCQKFTVAGATHRKAGKEYSDCLTPTRERVRTFCGVWVIENVVGAPMQHAIKLCGLMFGLKVFRHRLFECSHMIFQPVHPAHNGHRIGDGFYSIAGSSGKWRVWGASEGIPKGTVAEWRNAMGIDWMTGKEITQAIPPAYTEWIGRQLMRILNK